MSPAKTRTPTPMKSDLYDALTLELHRAEVLTEHVTNRLEDLVGESCNIEDSTVKELYALQIITQDISEKHRRTLEKAAALFEEARLLASVVAR